MHCLPRFTQRLGLPYVVTSTANFHCSVHNTRLGYTDFWVHLLICDGLYVDASHVPQNQLLKPLLMVTTISRVAHLTVHNTFNPNSHYFVSTLRSQDLLDANVTLLLFHLVQFPLDNTLQLPRVPDMYLHYPPCGSSESNAALNDSLPVMKSSFQLYH